MKTQDQKKLGKLLIVKKMKDKKVVKSKPITPLVKELPIPAPPSEKKHKDVSCEADMISISDQMLTVLSPVEQSDDQLNTKEGKVKPRLPHQEPDSRIGNENQENFSVVVDEVNGDFSNRNSLKSEINQGHST